MKRWNRQAELMEKRKWGSEERNYLLFDGMTKSMFYADLQKACERAKLKFRSPHKLRHAFATWFYSETNEDRFLAKKVVGHDDERSMAIYSHISEKIGLEQKRRSRGNSRLKAAE